MNIDLNSVKEESLKDQYSSFITSIPGVSWRPDAPLLEPCPSSHLSVQPSKSTRQPDHTFIHASILLVLVELRWALGPSDT